LQRWRDSKPRSPDQAPRWASCPNRNPTSSPTWALADGLCAQAVREDRQLLEVMRNDAETQRAMPAAEMAALSSHSNSTAQRSG
jgi:hypothetical protein